MAVETKPKTTTMGAWALALAVSTSGRAKQIIYRFVIQRILIPPFLQQMISYDVACNTCQDQV